MKRKSLWVALLLAAFSTALPLVAKEQTLLNVSYDPTRELYRDYNKVFAAYWQTKTGGTVKVEQSHG
ncbi:hypothetical protein EI021_30430, partial [Escherichia coli]|nr:hypothetical protein [Escherichia coli]